MSEDGAAGVVVVVGVDASPGAALRSAPTPKARVPPRPLRA